MRSKGGTRPAAKTSDVCSLCAIGSSAGSSKAGTDTMLRIRAARCVKKGGWRIQPSVVIRQSRSCLSHGPTAWFCGVLVHSQVVVHPACVGVSTPPVKHWLCDRCHTIRSHIAVAKSPSGRSLPLPPLEPGVASGAACVLCPAKSMRAVMRCVVVTPGEYPRFVHALCAVAVLPRSFALPHSTPYSPTTAVFEVPDELRLGFSMKRSHDKVRGRGGWRVPVRGPRGSGGIHGRMCMAGDGRVCTPSFATAVCRVLPWCFLCCCELYGAVLSIL